jgi:hypothetical protein
MVMPRSRVVFMPGIMGSVLTQPTPTRFKPRVVWGTGSILIWRARPKDWQAHLLLGNGVNRHGGIGLDVPPRETTDGVVEIARVAVPYAPFIARIRKAKPDLMVFPYDWRLSTDWTADLLKNAIEARWFPHPARDIHPRERVTIVAHSLGGLVSRYLIEALHGYRYVQRLITVGTPHQGAPSAYTHSLAKTQALKSVIMPLKVQLAVLDHCATSRQLLPNYDFVFTRGFALEPHARTYASMPAHKTGLSVQALIRLMRDDFQPRAPWRSLDAFLNANNVFYDCVGSTDVKTIRAYDSARGVIDWYTEGDGTVPLMSALCPEGPVSLATGVCTGTATNIRTHLFRGVVHQDLFLDRGVQDRCLELLGATPRTADLEEELATAATEMEFENELAGATEMEFENELAHSAW